MSPLPDFELSEVVSVAAVAVDVVVAVVNTVVADGTDIVTGGGGASNEALSFRVRFHDDVALYQV